MPIQPKTKGFIFAFIATIALANLYVFSKAALMEIHISQFAFFWFAIALSYNLAFLFFSKQHKSISKLSTKQKMSVVYIGLAETIATLLFFWAISIIEFPALTAFLGNVGPVFVAIGGIGLLHERFSLFEFIGILLTILGAFIISYDVKFENLIIEGTWQVIAASFFFSIATLLVKVNATKIHPSVLATFRSFLLLISGLVLMYIFDTSFSVPSSAVWNMAIGSLLGPFLTIITSYMALRYIEATRTAVIMSSRGIIVLISAYFYFNHFPAWYQILGGIITIIGVFILLKKKKESKISSTK